jgi:outer membrane protein assembly factor BamB
MIRGAFNKVIFANPDGKVLWKTSLPEAIEDPQAYAQAARISPDGRTAAIAYASTNGSKPEGVVVLDTSTGKLIWGATHQQYANKNAEVVEAVDIQSDSGRVAVAYGDGQVLVFNRAGKMVEEIDGSRDLSGRILGVNFGQSGAPELELVPKTE